LSLTFNRIASASSWDASSYSRIVRCSQLSLLCGARLVQEICREFTHPSGASPDFKTHPKHISRWHNSHDSVNLSDISLKSSRPNAPRPEQYSRHRSQSSQLHGGAISYFKPDLIPRRCDRHSEAQYSLQSREFRHRRSRFLRVSQGSKKTIQSDPDQHLGVGNGQTARKGPRQKSHGRESVPSAAEGVSQES
jgi:hypothetical protein